MNEDPHHFHTLSKSYSDIMKSQWEERAKIHDQIAKMIQNARMATIKKKIAERFKPKGG